MHYPILNSFLSGYSPNKLDLKHFPKLPMSSGGHPKNISLYDLCHSAHLLNLKGLLQQSEWI